MTLRDQLAAELHGASYPLRLTAEMRQRAKDAGLVIVYGASDDLMEFDGAINEEIGAYEGREALIDAKGVLDRYSIEDGDDDAIHDYVERKRNARCIEALWDNDGFSWTYQTDIPHATFEIIDDGEKYCRGMVIDLADLAPAAAAAVSEPAAPSEVVWSTDGERFNLTSLGDAIRTLRRDDVSPVGATVYFGTMAKPVASDFVDVEFVIDSMRDRAADEYGECAEDFPDVDKGAIAELEQLLEGWANKHCDINFWNVDDVTAHVIDETDVASALLVA